MTLSLIDRVVIASSNTGKLKEFAALLAPFSVDVIPQPILGVQAIEEPHATFVENALLKARHAARITGLPALADDSGLCVAALHGAPGVHSARFAGEPCDDQRNNALLLSRMTACVDRRAYFYAVVVLMLSADDPEPIICSGRWQGEIASVAHGDGGFGYDPVFFDTTLQCCAAQMTREQKNSRSHRGQALQALVTVLQARFGVTV